MLRREPRARPRLRLSFRTRLALATAAAVGVAVALAAAASFFVVRGRLLSQVDESLRRQAELVAQTSPIDPNGNIRIEGLSRLRNIRVSGSIVIQVVRQDGTVLIGDSQTRIPFSTIDAEVAQGERPGVIRSVAATPSSHPPAGPDHPGRAGTMPSSSPIPSRTSTTP